MNAKPALIALAVCAVLTVYLDRTPPLKVFNGQIIPNYVDAKKSVDVLWDQEWYKVCTGTITRHLVNVESGAIINFKPYEMMTPSKVGIGKFRGPLVIAEGTPPGATDYYADFVFSCNWLQQFFPIRVRTPSIRFTVTK